MKGEGRREKGEGRRAMGDGRRVMGEGFEGFQRLQGLYFEMFKEFEMFRV